MKQILSGNVMGQFKNFKTYSAKLVQPMERKIKTVLVDMSGTIHIENEVVPGSLEALKRLRKTDLNIKFVTNTTKESQRLLLERLRKIGFDIQPSEIFTSLTAAVKLIKKNSLRPFLIVDDRALDDFEGIETKDENAVVIGLAPEMFQYKTLNQAFRLLADGAPLIAIHKARYYKTSTGLSLGPGPFVTGLEYAADCKAEVVGKPEKSFFLSAIEEFNCQPDECIMIGDDVRDDVAGAQDCGMLGILVKTGKYRTKDEEKIDPKPYMTVNNFSHAVDRIVTNLLHQ
ncbi:haloacid dehalogenase-like hydrolase domain-containing protein 2 [Ostrea edulis]|uniref:haloacid dehalogenase-like hydrolase domain-containing protein 2 n=1 Tax=Ostrea edulis TaxID=37623 RepID=UPI0024AFE47B|nr:haloacid dehalogenase-like hydrolase domain-containing protein 2 [Ostrea edulis]